MIYIHQDINIEKQKLYATKENITCRVALSDIRACRAVRPFSINECNWYSQWSQSALQVRKICFYLINTRITFYCFTDVLLKMQSYHKCKMLFRFIFSWDMKIAIHSKIKLIITKNSFITFSNFDKKSKARHEKFQTCWFLKYKVKVR